MIPDFRNQTALVTGASAGIGRAYCVRLAATGANIVCVARRGDRLHELADELRAQYGVTVTPLVSDLSRPQAPDEIANALQANAITIDILVNNAGYGVPGRFLSSSWQVHADFNNVMMNAVARLSFLLLPAMLERRRGAIVNVASLAGFLPGTAGHTLYAAAKAWMIRYSESLALEYGEEGIRVCAVCPGFTRSEFHDVTGTRAQVSRMPSFMWMEAAQVVDESLRALVRGESVYVPGRINRVIARAARYLPRALVRGIARREAHRFRDASL